MKTGDAIIIVTSTVLGLLLQAMVGVVSLIWLVLGPVPDATQLKVVGGAFLLSWLFIIVACSHNFVKKGKSNG